MSRLVLGFIVATMMLLAHIHALPSSLQYQVGQEFIFNLHGTVDARGNVQRTASITNGTVSSLDSIYVHRCDQIQSDGSYIFVANMFNTQVGVGQSVPEASANRARLTTGAQRSSYKTSIVSAPQDAEPLGYDMYFQQQPSGEITTIWYNTADSAYFVQVKISAISAFQTHVTQGIVNGVLEQDPVGTHTSNYQGSAAAMLNIAKQYNQQNFRSFSDAQVTANNVAIAASALTTVHNEGYIYSTTVSQVTNVVSMQIQAAARDIYTNSTGFDMNWRSAGALTITLSNQQKLVGFAPKVSPVNNANFTSGSLFEVGKTTIQTLAAQDYKLPRLSQEDAVSVMDSVLSSGKPLKQHHKDITGLVQFFNSPAPRVVQSIAKAKIVLSKYANLVKINNDRNMRDKLFYLLVGASKNFEELFLSEFVDAFEADNEKATDVLFHAITSANTGLKQGSSATIRKIFFLFQKYSQANPHIRDAALLAFGSLVSRSSDASLRKDASSVLLEMMDRLTNNAAQDPYLIVTVLGAIYNAGPEVVSTDAVMQRAAKIMATETNPRIIAALKMVLSSFAKKNNIPSSKLMLQDSPYPYNRSISQDYNVGGDTVSIDIHGDLFIGTNFDCNHPNFNYLGSAEAYANVNVLGEKAANIFDAKAQYGKQGSQLVADEIFLSVFDKVVYQKTLGGQFVDCNLHTYQLYHTSPSFSVSYTVWVSIVPITFTAAADLGLDASWGWQICDAQLSALVEIMPSAELTVSGKAEIDLLIIRGGVELDASFQATLIPQAYIHGTLCTAGIDVQLQTQPMTADLDVYYAVKHCKYLIFDCHWGNHDTKTLWSWSLPSKQQTLFNKEWKISV